MISREIENTIYKRIALRGTQTIDELSELLEVDREKLVQICKVLQNRGLVSLSEESISLIQWWEKPHLHLFIEPPWLEEKVFTEFCGELDGLADSLRSSGFQVVRQYSHETSLEILLTASLLTSGGLLAKSLLASLGKRIGDFVGDMITKYLNKGIKAIEIKGSKELPNGITITFTIHGIGAHNVIQAFEELSSRMEVLADEARKGIILDEVKENNKNWNLEIRK